MATKRRARNREGGRRLGILKHSSTNCDGGCARSEPGHGRLLYLMNYAKGIISVTRSSKAAHRQHNCGSLEWVNVHVCLRMGLEDRIGVAEVHTYPRLSSHAGTFDRDQLQIFRDLVVPQRPYDGPCGVRPSWWLPGRQRKQSDLDFVKSTLTPSLTCSLHAC